METELAAAKEEQRNLAETANVSGLGKEEIVKRAFELRDQAVKRKNQVEIELAKTRIEIMQINSQLMESIQQKVELSQQLEQWQVSSNFFKIWFIWLCTGCNGYQLMLPAVNNQLNCKVNISK